MVAIMRDGLGVGLAATQLGLMRRLLVFQAGFDASPTAVANPVIEWTSGELADRRGGLPRASPGSSSRSSARFTCACSGLDASGEPAAARGLGARGARAPARDRPPRRRADPRPHRARAAQGRAAGAARGRVVQPRASRATSPRPRPRLPRPTWREPGLPRDLGLRGRGASPPRGLAAPPIARRHAARQPPRAGAQDGVAAGGRRRARARHRGAPGRDVNEPEAAEAVRAADPGLAVVCAFGQLIKRAAARRARDAQRPSLAAAALARRRADRARDHGPRPGDRRLRDAA